MDTFMKQHVPEWQNEMRCQGLFSNLPPNRDINRSSWDDKVQFWKRVILDAYRHGQIQSISNDGYFYASFIAKIDNKTLDLSTLFMRNGLIPKCLSRVWVEMVRDGCFVKADEITKGQAKSMTSYLFNLSFNLVTSFGKMIIGGGDSEDSEEILSEKYANVSLLDETMKKFLDRHENTAYYTDYLYTLSELRDKLNSMISRTDISESDALLFAKYLESQGNALTKQDGKLGIIVKIRRNLDKEMTISGVDEGVLSIRKTMGLIEKQIQDLNHRSEELTKRAKEYLSRKQELLAKKCLKSRKALVTLLQQRSDAHFQLETILLRLQHVETESEILSAYDSGSTSLASYMKTHGLTIDKVDEVVLNLQETLADSEEISTALKLSGDEISGVDDEEVEKELELLLKATQEPSHIILPEVPKHEPQFVVKEEAESKSTKMMPVE